LEFVGGSLNARIPFAGLYSKEGKNEYTGSVFGTYDSLPPHE
jgi:hypothetical protein